MINEIYPIIGIIPCNLSDTVELKVVKKATKKRADDWSAPYLFILQLLYYSSTTCWEWKGQPGMTFFSFFSVTGVETGLLRC